MPGGALLQDYEGRILMANRETERIFRISVKKMQARRMEELQWSAVHEDGSPLPLDEYPFQLALLSGKPVKDIFMGLLQDHDKGCRLFISALPRFKAGRTEVFQVVSIFIEISAPRQVMKSV